MFSIRALQTWTMILGTVSKALHLLDLLKDPSTRMGLTEIARLARFAKATTRRLLLELIANGFAEQDESGKHYVLGPSLQMLGKAREERFPFYKTVLPIVRTLAETTGETVHAAEYAAGSLISVCIQESDKANRVSLSPGMKLPLHSTASGTAYLAAATPEFVEQFLRKPRTAFTSHTAVDAAQIQKLIKQARMRGYSISNQAMEDGIHSVAATFVDPKGKPVGTIAVAMPSIRATPAKIAACGDAVKAAVLETSTKLYGQSFSLRKAS